MRRYRKQTIVLLVIFLTLVACGLVAQHQEDRRDYLVLAPDTVTPAVPPFAQDSEEKADDKEPLVNYESGSAVDRAAATIVEEPEGVAGVDNNGDARPLVCLSPGHPSEPGDKLYEAVINRRVAHFLNQMLLDAGYGTTLTTPLHASELFSDSFNIDDETTFPAFEAKLPLDRGAHCKTAGADYVISVHHNYAGDITKNHTLVFYRARIDYKPAHAMAKKWANKTALALGRTMKTSRAKAVGDYTLLKLQLGVLEGAEIPGILTEASFYSNPEEQKRLNDPGYLKKEAQAIFNAFQDVTR